MAKKKYDSSEGVWRTIGGRRVFIKTGQSLSDAMKESGKFKKKDKEQEFNREEFNKWVNENSDKNIREYEKDTGKDALYNNGDPTKEFSDYEYELYKRNGYLNKERTYEQVDKIREQISQPVEYDYKSVNARELTEDKFYTRKDGTKEYDPYKGTRFEKKYDSVDDVIKDPNSSLNKYINEKEQSKYQPTEIEYMAQDGKMHKMNSYDYPAERDEYHKFLQDKYGTYKEEEINENWKKLREDFYDSRNTQKSWRDKLDTEEGRKEIFDKELDKSTRDKMYDYYNKGKENGKLKNGNDFLPKSSKITTPGTSNRKEVSDNIQAHILEYYDNPVDFMEQMDAMDYYPTRWHAGQELAKGGSYLIYYDEQRDFLNSLNINPKGKTFSDDRVFDVYTNLVGRESDKLYNRLQKLFDQYKKEHKGTDVSLDDFRKWFK